MRRLLQLLISQPALLLEHATAYADLLSADARTATDAGKQTALWSAALLCCVSVTAILAGVGLMVWATVPENAIRWPWMLVAVPLVPGLAALVCLRKLQPPLEEKPFAKVRRQIAADLQMLREVDRS